MPSPVSPPGATPAQPLLVAQALAGAPASRYTVAPSRHRAPRASLSRPLSRPTQLQGVDQASQAKLLHAEPEQPRMEAAN